MKKREIIREFFASLVVFFIALPLCLGIAMASGVPPAAGLLTGIVGGIVAGYFAGCRVQVSGPAAGLTVVVLEFVQLHGFATLSVVVVAAGVLQWIAARLKLGRLFQAVSPAVVYGMLAGIGLIIMASQFHVMLDGKTRGAPIANIIAIPEAITTAVASADTLQAALLGGFTIVVMLLWKWLKLGKRTGVPEALPAILLATLGASLLGLNVHRVDVPDKVSELIAPVSLIGFTVLSQWAFIKAVLTLAFVASAESMLSAASVDQLHTCDRTDYNKELSAQGKANIVSGLLGGLPLTGVIVRSRVNIEAGAKTRWSAVLHGVWLLGAVALVPSVLELIPTCSLAALLVLTGWKLMDLKVIKTLKQFGWAEVMIFLATMGLVVGEDLLTGVLAGLGLALLRVGYQLVTMLEIKLTHEGDRYALELKGLATFAMKWKIGITLDHIPDGAEVHLSFAKLQHLDHGCLEMLLQWEQRHSANGGKVVFDRAALIAKAVKEKKSAPKPKYPQPELG